MTAALALILFPGPADEKTAGSTVDEVVRRDATPAPELAESGAGRSEPRRKMQVLEGPVSAANEPRRRRHLWGLVTDPDGNPIFDAEVRVEHGFELGTTLARTRTDRQGRYEIRSLGGELWRLPDEERRASPFTVKARAVVWPHSGPSPVWPPRVG